jgi:DNA mismatch repair protein PMS2
LDKIIVSDNGDGITKTDLENLGKAIVFILKADFDSFLASNRYSTSKIETDSDLETSENYGFRGEALHSLVTLSKSLSVLTSPEDSGSGLCKKFDNFGLSSEIITKPRSKGSTVTIEGLFAGISVRKLDWFKRKAQIMAQAVFLAQSYAIMSSGVRISLSIINESGVKTSVFVSRGLDAKSNHTDCFGSTRGQLSKEFNAEFAVMERYLNVWIILLYLCFCLARVVFKDFLFPIHQPRRNPNPDLLFSLTKSLLKVPNGSEASNKC